MLLERQRPCRPGRSRARPHLWPQRLRPTALPAAGRTRDARTMLAAALAWTPPSPRAPPTRRAAVRPPGGRATAACSSPAHRLVLPRPHCRMPAAGIAESGS
ncbi:hypothetical protein GQ55_8G193100 [Panicum hallii var. hallii]|uniref:Uncharacterized protein n=1 Tax=Panicum hallii var. hallii TaxID=1504633 RepID=A0A2T7CP21_9POAL|nr:hypothetical protein GQ55_8G193100 [Panicum hallii var. hallii]